MIQMHISRHFLISKFFNTFFHFAHIRRSVITEQSNKEWKWTEGMERIWQSKRLYSWKQTCSCSLHFCSLSLSSLFRLWFLLHNWLSTAQAELVSTYLLSGSLDDLARCHIGSCFSSTQDSRRLQCRISKLEMGFPTILTFVQVWDKRRGYILHQDYSPAKRTHKMQWTLRSLHYDLSHGNRHF